MLKVLREHKSDLWVVAVVCGALSRLVNSGGASGLLDVLLEHRKDIAVVNTCLDSLRSMAAAHEPSAAIIRHNTVRIVSLSLRVVWDLDRLDVFASANHAGFGVRRSSPAPGGQNCPGCGSFFVERHERLESRSCGLWFRGNLTSTLLNALRRRSNFWIS